MLFMKGYCPLASNLHKLGMRIFAVCIVLAGLSAPLASAELPALEGVRMVEPARAIPDATLTNQDGHPFRISELQGRVTLLLFGFTHCPDICPLTMERFRQAHDIANYDPAKVAFVMISVDGDRDTPELVKEYVARFSSDFIGLTGQPRDVKALAKNFSATFFKGGHDAHGDYTVAHSSQVFVVDAAGRLRAEIYGPSVEALTGITDALLEGL
jgi:protein SCO1/2